MEGAASRATAAKQQTDVGPTQAIKMDQLMYFTLVNVSAVAENLSRQTSPYTGMVIDGATAQIRRDEDELKPLLAGVYQEHQESVAPYMTPTTILMTYLARIGSENVRPADEKKDSARVSARQLETPPPQPSTEAPST